MKTPRGPNDSPPPQKANPDLTPLAAVLSETRSNLQSTWEQAKQLPQMSGRKFADLLYHVDQVQAHLTSVQALVGQIEKGTKK